MGLTSALASVIGSGISAVSNVVGSIIGKPKDNSPSYGSQLRMQAEQQRLVQEQYSKEFRNYAKNMGISPYALLGYQMPSGPAGGAIQSDSPSRLGSTIRQMGQDVERGLNNYIALKDAEKTGQVKDAQARLFNAQADKIINSQTQEPPGGRIVERDIPEWEDHSRYQKMLRDRGVGFESDLKVDPMYGYIKYYPSQDVQDYISESKIAETGYLQGMAAYKLAISRGKHGNSAYERDLYRREKAKIESLVGERVYWNGARWRLLRFMKK